MAMGASVEVNDAWYFDVDALSTEMAYCVDKVARPFAS
jgi:hypothetical protein